MVNHHDGESMMVSAMMIEDRGETGCPMIAAENGERLLVLNPVEMGMMYPPEVG